MTRNLSSNLVVKRLEKQRLTFYRSQADRSFWHEVWENILTPNFYDGAKRGALGLLENIFMQYLPKSGPILEAGCGLGQIVLALRVRGYDCEGIEWVPQTVETVQQILPDLPIRIGDVTNIEAPNNYFKGYISLGVVEHSREGPESFLIEARRVLADDGIMLISVPFFNKVRQFKARLGFYRTSLINIDFYQYAFTIKEMTSILHQCGFIVDNYFGYDPFLGIETEVPFTKSIFATRFGQRLSRKIQQMKIVQQMAGHMVLFVCRKNNECLTIN